MTNEIQYVHAIGENGNVIHIGELTHLTRKQAFTCPECEHILIPKLGKVRQHHFAHKQEQVCNPETYLHQVAKHLLFANLKERIRAEKPFFVELEHWPECEHSDPLDDACYQQTNERYDLLRYFKEVRLEKKHAEFRPDVQLINQKGDVLYLEIKVTHESEDVKKKSEHRQVEIDITSEEDLELVRGNLLSYQDSRITIRNFNVKEKTADLCKNRCPKEIHVFLVDKAGKSHIRTIEKYKLLHISKRYPFYQIIDHSTDADWGWSWGATFIKNVIKAQSGGVAIKNCFLCRYHALNESVRFEGTIFCKYLKKAGSSNMAADCSAYRPDKVVYSKYEGHNQ